MTQKALEAANLYREAYLRVLTEYKSECSDMSVAVNMCEDLYAAGVYFIDALTEWLPNIIMSRKNIYFTQISSIINIPELYNGEFSIIPLKKGSRLKIGISFPEFKASGENKAAKIELFIALCQSSMWVPSTNESMDKEALDQVRTVLIAKARNTQKIEIDSDEDTIITSKVQDCGKISRAQSIALLYAIFVRLKITQSYTATAIAKLIEAVTGGLIRDSKNSYAWKHLNDKLQPDVEALLDEFMKGGQSSE